MGHEIVPNTQTQGVWIRHEDKSHQIWNPLSPTTQGKADLQDLMLALDIGHEVNGQYMDAWRGDEAHDGYIERTMLIRNGDKQKALAEAVVSVASQIWESKQ